MNKNKINTFLGPIYKIFIYGKCFVQYLVIECNNLIENISNSMTVMILSSIKLQACRGLSWSITKCLKNRKSQPELSNSHSNNQ